MKYDEQLPAYKSGEGSDPPLSPVIDPRPLARAPRKPPYSPPGCTRHCTAMPAPCDSCKGTCAGGTAACGAGCTCGPNCACGDGKPSGGKPCCQGGKN